MKNIEIPSYMHSSQMPITELYANTQGKTKHIDEIMLENCKKYLKDSLKRINIPFYIENDITYIVVDDAWKISKVKVSDWDTELTHIYDENDYLRFIIYPKNAQFRKKNMAKECSYLIINNIFNIKVVENKVLVCKGKDIVHKLDIIKERSLEPRVKAKGRTIEKAKTYLNAHYPEWDLI